MYSYYYRPGPFDPFIGSGPTPGSTGPGWTPGSTGSGWTPGSTGQMMDPSMGTPSPPSFAPPSTIPPKPQQLSQTYGGGQIGYLLSAPAVSVCLYTLSYVWPAGGNRGFWFWAYYVDHQSAAGYMWSPMFRRWVRTGFDLRTIDSITCL